MIATTPARLACLAALLALAAPARAQLGMDFSQPPPKKDGKKPEPKKAPPAKKPDAPAAAPSPELPPPMAAPARPRKKDDLGLDLASVKEAKERLDAAKRLLDEKRHETAALAFDQLLREPAMVSVHEEARYQLGKALARLGLRHSALAAFDAVLDASPTGAFRASAMEALFLVGAKLENEQPLLARVARHAKERFPPNHEDRFHFLLAKYEFERARALDDAGRGQEAKAAYAEARRLAALVREAPTPAPGAKAAPEPDGDLFARARFVDGLVRYAQADPEGATESFKDVVRLTNPKRGHADPALREQAFLQLARIHYESRQNRYAIFYYSKMPWGGENWLEGLWEASWAQYRIGDYEKTLGNLLTLQSPYFRDEYYPESYVLKAIVYYENCRYPEARGVLETFTSLYEPVYDELTRLTATEQPLSTWYALVEDGAARRTPLARKLVHLALSDQGLRQLTRSIREVEEEADRGIGGRATAFRESALAKRLLADLAAERAGMVDEAGARARAKLEYERDGLRTQLAQSLRIRAEILKKEREALEGSLAKGSQVEVVKDLKYSSAVSDEHLYWPYEGEFWRDELGTYSYTLTRGCKDRLPRSQQSSTR